MDTYLKGKSYLQGLTSRFTAPPAPITPVVKEEKEKKRFSGYGLNEQENILVASKLDEIRKGNSAFVLPHLNKLVDVFLKDIHTVDDNMLASYLEVLNPMFTQSKMDLQYLEERGREIEDLIIKGKERIKKSSNIKYFVFF